MPDASKSRRKHKLEPLSYEELMDTAGMSGFGGLMDVKPDAFTSLPHLLPPGAATPPVGVSPIAVSTPEGISPAEVVIPPVGVSLLVADLPAADVSPPEYVSPPAGIPPP